jgi:hypothetical protein
MSWTVSVPQVVNGDPLKAKSVNSPVNILAERTVVLKNLLDSIKAGQQLVLKNIPVESTSLPGHVVYLDNATLLHKKALSKWDILNANQQATPADSSIFTGVIINKTTDYVADVLIEGIAELDSPAQTRLFNSITPSAGIYFLSNSVEGTVIKTKPAMGVRVLEYYSDGVIRVFPPQHEPITHTHMSFLLLEGEWLPAGSFSDPPAGATYGYAFTTLHAIDVNLVEAILAGVGDATFIGRDTGTHLFEDLIFKDENGIWFTDVTPPDQDIELNVLSADVKDMALLHSIRTSTPAALNIINSNGRVTINTIDYTTSEDTPTGTAVISINAITRAVKIAKVVTKVQAGAGITVTASGPNGSNVITVGSSLFNNLAIPAQVLNLNNSVTSVEGVHVITQLPINRLSSVHCRCLLPDFGSGTYTAKIFCQIISPVANQPAPECSYSLVPTPNVSGVTPGADTVIALPNIPGSVSAGDIYYVASADIPLTGASRGMLNYVLTADNPDDPINIVATGIILIQV